ncbi:MAG: ankyrin repeat domain-containing protein [Planctomycetota bacterium]
MSVAKQSDSSFEFCDHVVPSSILSTYPLVSQYRNTNGESLLFQCNCAECFRLLISSGVDPDCSRNDSWAALHLFAYLNDFRRAEWLIKYGANTNIRDSNLDTPLHIASLWGNFDFISTLLNAGVDPNHSNANGDTPLHYAIPNCSFRLVSKFIANGASVIQSNKNGVTPLDMAKAMGNDEMLGILQVP